MYILAYTRTAWSLRCQIYAKDASP